MHSFESVLDYPVSVYIFMYFTPSFLQNLYSFFIFYFIGKMGGFFIKDRKKLVYIDQICSRDTFEKCLIARTKWHSHGVPVYKKSHTYFQNTKYGQSVNASKKLTCVLPFFTRPSATEFASRYMWCRWTTYSLLRNRTSCN